MISAWAVGSWALIGWFQPRPSTTPSRTTSAPTGTSPRPAACSASASACAIQCSCSAAVMSASVCAYGTPQRGQNGRQAGGTLCYNCACITVGSARAVRHARNDREGIMTKRTFWTADWFAVLLIALALVVFSRSDLIQGLERTTYDIGVRSADRDAGNQVAVIAIDDESIENLGRWPWPRDIIARLVDQLRQADAKVIGLTTLLSEPQTDPGLKQIETLNQFYQNSSLHSASDDDVHQADLLELGNRLQQAAVQLDTDSRMASSIANAGNVVLGMQMIPGQAFGNPDELLPDYVTRFQASRQHGGDALPFTTIDVVPPIPEFGKAAAGIGHLVTLLDVDGAVRYEPLLLDFYGEHYPSMPLMVAARSLNLAPDDIQITAQGIRLGGLQIGTDANLMMNTFFYSAADDKPAFSTDSFYDVYTGKIDPAKYKGRIVLIGATAFGLGSTLKTPLPKSVEPVQVMAHTVASILNEDFFTLPPWANGLKWLLMLVVLGYLLFVLPRIGA